MVQFPKSREQPLYRTPVNRENPESYDKRQIRFRFDLLDFDHELWGWEKLTQEQHIDVLRFLHTLEKQTWAEIKLAAGGRRQGTNHHPLHLYEFSKNAQARIRELNLEKIIGDTLFSLRLNNGIRLYGLRDAEFFRTIWHDPFHIHPQKAAYPCGR